MQLIVVSDDPEILHICDEITGEFQFCDLRTVTFPSASDLASAEVVLWDYSRDTDTETAPDKSSSAELVLLIRRSELTQLLAEGRVQHANILLKPLERSLVRLFLQHAIVRRASTTANLATHTQQDPMFQLLLAANLRLQELDHDRKNMLARTMHDFRVPLTALQGYAGLLMSGCLGSLTPDQTDVVRGMNRTIKRLSMLSTGLLEFTLGGGGSALPPAQEVAVERCVEQALHEVANLAAENEIDLRCRVEQPTGIVRFDPGHLEQVLINLLENACKFTPRGGRVELLGYPIYWDRSSSLKTPVCAKSQNCNSFRIDIIDSGRGIPSDRVETIFREYTSYGGGTDRSGGGLGLSICRLIVEAYGGRIWASSPGEGSIFSFVIPCAPAISMPVANEHKSKSSYSQM